MPMAPAREQVLVCQRLIDRCGRRANSGNFLAAGGITGSVRELFERTAGVGRAKETQALTMISDEALMLEFQRGSREAFEELFARYREPLFGFFRRRLENRERAEDLAQETFLAVIRAVTRYEP